MSCHREDLSVDSRWGSENLEEMQRLAARLRKGEVRLSPTTAVTRGALTLLAREQAAGARAVAAAAAAAAKASESPADAK